MAQKTPLTTLTVMYADRWNGTWFMELGNFQEQLILDYQIRFLITGFLRLKRQWLQYLSIIKSGLFYFFQIVVLNYLSKFKKWQPPVLQNQETKKKLKNWLMHLKTEFSLKNSFLTAYLKLKQLLFKNFISAQKTHVLKNLTLFAVVDTNNNFNYNFKPLSNKQALLFKNWNKFSLISHSMLNISLFLHLKTIQWGNSSWDFLCGVVFLIGGTGFIAILNKLNGADNQEDMQDIILFPNWPWSLPWASLPSSASSTYPVNKTIQDSTMLSPKQVRIANQLFEIDNDIGPVLYDAAGNLVVPEPSAIVRAASRARSLQHRIANNIISDQNRVENERAADLLYKQSFEYKESRQQHMLRARKLFNSEVDPKLSNWEIDTTKYPKLSTITDPTGTYLVPQIEVAPYGWPRTTHYIVKGVPVGEHTSNFFGSVELDLIDESKYMVYVDEKLYLNHILLVEEILFALFLIIFFLIFSLLFIIGYLFINNYEIAKWQKENYSLYLYVLIVFSIEQCLSRFFIRFKKLCNRANF